jgi:hypothetical protein
VAINQQRSYSLSVELWRPLSLHRKK